MYIKKILATSILVSLFGGFALANEGAATLKVNINGIENKEGQILATLCKKEQFLKTKCDYSAMLKLGGDNELQLKIENIVPGEYALQMFQDVNSDYKMQSSMMGIPTEPFAFSNNAKGRFGPPKFEDAAFAIQGNTEISVSFEQ